MVRLVGANDLQFEKAWTTGFLGGNRHVRNVNKSAPHRAFLVDHTDERHSYA